MTQKTTKSFVGPACPGCSGTRMRKTEDPMVYECVRCNGIVGTTYRGDAYKFVHIGTLVAQTDGMTVRYFDLTLLGSNGVDRVHGWFDDASKNVVQYG